MTKEQEYKWQPMFYRIANRNGVCNGCNKEMCNGEIIFYFPNIKQDPYSKRGSVYCSECIVEKINAIVIAESL